jgi:hypothetical protein
MKAETLKNIFYFLERKQGAKPPWLWKHMNNIPSTKEELIVNGDYILDNSKTTSLPEGLDIRGSLYITECLDLTSLPKGLKVGVDFLLKECPSLTSLPEGLKVGRNLTIRDCLDLTSLSKGLKLDYLSLKNCQSLTSLPEGLQVEYDLYLNFIPLAKLSDSDLLKMIGPNGYIKQNIVKTNFDVYM